MNLHDIRPPIPDLHPLTYYRFQIIGASHTGRTRHENGSRLTGYLLDPNTPGTRLTGRVTINVPFWNQDVVDYVNDEVHDRGLYGIGFEGRDLVRYGIRPA